MNETLHKKIDAFVTQQMKKEHTPGVALGVFRRGRFIYAKGYGFANLEQRTGIYRDTLFQSGSLGKQFTATAVMILAEQGKLSLDHSLATYLELPKSWRGITIRQLLTHTAGTGDYQETFDYRKDYSEADLLQHIIKSPLQFTRGEQWYYSNFGYVLLGILVRHVTGMFYGDFLQRMVFGPAGMTTARIISEADIIPRRAAGYEVEKGKLVNQAWVAPSLCTPADGSLYLSLRDYAKWDAALWTEQLLKQTSLEQMWTPVRLNNRKVAVPYKKQPWGYGFGWFVSLKGPKIVWHDGSWQGFKTAFYRYLDDELSIVALANCAASNPNTIVKYVASLLRDS
jgi:CubicO group peptidase (beta-lactamase class C family)